jgi:alpha-tubulin suppressor-like RCC1 family protein
LCEATALAVGTTTRCAVVSDGSVRCWGGLQESVFGKQSSRTPVAVPDVAEATAVVAGASGYACALIVDGSVTCWGGGPRQGDRPGIQPTPVPEITGAIALSGSESLGPDLCALLADGTVTCWSHAAAPTPLPEIEGVVSFAHSLSHACAALDDGSVRCWGRNQTGQLGNGTAEDSDSPVTVEGLSGATAVAVGALDSTIGQSCALLDDGTARCWGSNFRGQLGDGTTADSSTPVEVRFP